jgi:hypothetical protein
MTMSPDFAFWLALAAKMLVTVAFVVAATVTAERAGALIGALVATLPISAGPAYVFLALDHDAKFIAQSALGSLAINAINVIFALAYALLAQRRALSVAMPAALGLWFVLAVSANAVPWTLPSALLLNVVVLPVCLAIGRRLRDAPMPPVRQRWYDALLRALGVSVLVGTVVTVSFWVGPTATGILAVFPIVLLSIMIILHRRVGGPASAAVLANGISGLVGFGLTCITLHLAAVPLGVAVALSLALAVSIGWNVFVWSARRRGIPV